jgi:hypothetical protein
MTDQIADRTVAWLRADLDDQIREGKRFVTNKLTSAYKQAQEIELAERGDDSLTVLSDEDLEASAKKTAESMYAILD